MGYHTLITEGLTNKNSEDYGDYVSGKISDNHKSFYCTSEKCCRYVIEEKLVCLKKFNGIAQMNKRFGILPKVFKFSSTSRSISDCPDCGNPLIVK